LSLSTGEGDVDCLGIRRRVPCFAPVFLLVLVRFVAVLVSVYVCVLSSLFCFFSVFFLLIVSRETGRWLFSKSEGWGRYTNYSFPSESGKAKPFLWEGASGVRLAAMPVRKQ
jgi:hypothetical protein